MSVLATNSFHSTHIGRSGISYDYTNKFGHNDLTLACVIYARKGNQEDVEGSIQEWIDEMKSIPTYSEYIESEASRSTTSKQDYCESDATHKKITQLDKLAHQMRSLAHGGRSNLDNMLDKMLEMASIIYGEIPEIYLNLRNQVLKTQTEQNFSDNANITLPNKGKEEITSELLRIVTKFLSDQDL